MVDIFSPNLKNLFIEYPRPKLVCKFFHIRVLYFIVEKFFGVELARAMIMQLNVFFKKKLNKAFRLWSHFTIFST